MQGDRRARVQNVLASLGYIFIAGLLGAIVGSLVALVGHYALPGAESLIRVGLGGGLLVGVVLGASLGIFIALTDHSALLKDAFLGGVGVGAIAGGALGLAFGGVARILEMGTSGVFNLVLAFGTEGFVVCACVGAALRLSIKKEERKAHEKEVDAAVSAMRNPFLKMKAASIRTCDQCGLSWESTGAGLIAIIGGTHSAMYDPASLVGLTCTGCGKSWCKNCLGGSIPSPLPGGKCPSCGGQLNLF